MRSAEGTDSEPEDNDGDSELFWETLDKRSDEFWRKYAIHMKSIDADPQLLLVLITSN